MASGVAFLLLLSAACVIGTIVIDDFEVEKSWLKFKKDFNKVYANSDEEEYRRNVYEKALQEVFVFNMAYKRGEETYYIGINQFSDMTDEEWLKHREITCSITSNRQSDTNATEFTNQLVAEFGGPPDKASWAQFISPIVRNQNIGSCGGCYAFAAVSAVESNWAKKHNKPPPECSEQEIIDCGKKYGCKGCAGGHPCGAYDTIKGEGGLTSAKLYPWRKDQKKAHACDKVLGQKGLITINGYNELNKPTHRDFTLQTMVGVKGPATASVCANAKFKKYDGGIFNDPNCYTECATAANNGINHSVLAFAYDENTFTIRNSWGKGWGENGNMRITRVKVDRTTGICGLARDVSFPLVD